ncbi:3-oxoacyl-ACP synthase III family protein [Microvirga lotononidis]|uniref:3-oxoacyl-(Acyl-carrier-protein) synthase III n=1 Tax=Microvirga lotononidis TaxID=864069 RepID=I4YNR9_9HYPH|nr:ketoacyl-ACP synthase III [Microvirga lotononidis]EIM25611.1 3-oxoacyl-(acyl-carrier-protein) synthase III [Microvirga lotononidis]WQO26087.1 ketoacyl-ACP synthase III [Microvirga lotononidis]
MHRSTDSLERALATKVGIEAIAYALPERVITNDDLARENPAWDMVRLLDRTGVEERRIAAADETALDLGYRACLALEQRGKLVRSEIDTIIFCTETPDHPIPPNSCILHQRLGLSPHVMAFDITLACSGFVYSLGIARGLVQSGTSRRVLIVTADTYSRLIHPADRSSRCLFGDGAAATIVSGFTDDQLKTADDRLNVADISFGTSGAQYDRFIVRAGGTRLPRSTETAKEVSDRSGNIRTAEHIEMDGLGVLSFFNTTIPKAVRELLNRNNLRVEDVGSFVFHQASKVAIDGIARSLGLNADQLIFDMRTLGNTVSASVPIALQRAQEAEKIRKDRPVVLCGFGVGLSWASALINP